MLNLFTAAQPVPHEVCGTVHNFYPISTKLLTQLRGVARPIAKAFTTLFSSTESDSKRENHEETRGDSGYTRRVSLDAISPELAKIRAAQKQEAIEQMVDGILNDGTARTFAQIVIDSMRDAFPRGNRTPGELDKFLEDTPAEAFRDMLMGVVAANRKLLDPLVRGMSEVGDSLKAKFEVLRNPSQQSETTTSSG